MVIKQPFRQKPYPAASLEENLHSALLSVVIVIWPLSLLIRIHELVPSLSVCVYICPFFSGFFLSSLSFLPSLPFLPFFLPPSFFPLLLLPSLSYTYYFLAVQGLRCCVGCCFSSSILTPLSTSISAFTVLYLCFVVLTCDPESSFMQKARMNRRLTWCVTLLA